MRKSKIIYLSRELYLLRVRIFLEPLILNLLVNGASLRLRRHSLSARRGRAVRGGATSRHVVSPTALFFPPFSKRRVDGKRMNSSDKYYRCLWGILLFSYREKPVT